MPYPENKEFVDKVLGHIKFGFDRESIKEELQEHIEDIYEDLISEGMSEEEAGILAIELMGEPDEIGRELNKVHNPIIGWVWLITRLTAFISVIFICISMVFGAYNCILSIFFTGYDIVHEGTNLVYSVKCDNETKIDDMYIRIDEIIYYDNGELEVRYRTWKELFSQSIDWTFSLGSNCLYDEYGNSYWYSGGGSGGGPITRNQMFFEDFPEDAEMVIINSDVNGRKIYFEIPLHKAVANI